MLMVILDIRHVAHLKSKQSRPEAAQIYFL